MKKRTELTDWKRNNKIGLRNFDEEIDFHDLVKTLLVRMLRRNYPNNNHPIYTEYNPSKPNDSYPDIWFRLNSDIIVFELQEEITDKWKEKILEKYKEVDLIIVPLIEIKKQWIDKLHSKKYAENTDPIKLLRQVLEEYVI